MKKSQVIITGLLILMVVASLCIGSTTPTTSPTTSSQTESVTSSHTYSSTSTTSTTTSSPCQSCQIGHNGTQNGTSQGGGGSQTNASTNTSVPGNGGNGINGTSSNSSISTGNSSTSGNNSPMVQNETFQNSTQNTTMTQLPHPFPEYKLPINDSLIRFYIYGSHECCGCRRLLQFLGETYGNDSIVFYEISNGTNNTIVSKGFLVNYPEMGYLPITGITYNGTLVAIVSGYNLPYDVEGLIKMALKYQVLVIKDPSGKIHYVGSEKTRAALEEVFMYNRLPSGS